VFGGGFFALCTAPFARWVATVVIGHQVFSDAGRLWGQRFFCAVGDVALFAVLAQVFGTRACTQIWDLSQAAFLANCAWVFFGADCGVCLCPQPRDG
jgi:hypothetical protein